MWCPRLLSWNLSVWVAQPFVKFENFRPDFDPATFATKVENLKTILPEKLAFTNEAQLSTHMGLFISLEIDALNNILRFTHGELARFLSDARSSHFSEDAIKFAQGEIPRIWITTTGLYTCRTTTQYSSHIIERHSQLVRLSKEPSPVIFDMRLVEHPKLLLEAFLTDNAIETNRSIDALQYDFSSGDGIAIEPGALFLTRVTITCAEVKTGVVCLKKEPDASPARSVSALIAKIVPKGKGNSKGCPLPLYRQAIVSAIMGEAPELKNTANGESENFVWTVNLPADSAEARLTQAGVMFFCRMLPQIL
jgi:hypothetical protein